jgi:hypothetical protein
MRADGLYKRGVGGKIAFDIRRNMDEPESTTVRKVVSSDRGGIARTRGDNITHKPGPPEPLDYLHNCVLLLSSFQECYLSWLETSV